MAGWPSGQRCELPNVETWVRFQSKSKLFPGNKLLILNEIFNIELNFEILNFELNIESIF